MEITIKSPRDVFMADKQREIRDAYMSGVKMSDITIRMKFIPGPDLESLIMNDVKRIKKHIIDEVEKSSLVMAGNTTI